MQTRGPAYAGRRAGQQALPSAPLNRAGPSAAQVLAFAGDAGEVFAKIVHFPGATMPPYPAIEPAFAAAEGELRGLIERTVKQAAAGAV